MSRQREPAPQRGVDGAAEHSLGNDAGPVPTTTPNHVALLAALGVAGAGFMIAKGAIRATSGDDLSFVPAFLFLTGFGIWALADTVSETCRFARTVIVGRTLAALAIASGLVALAYVLTGTIPETDNAPAAVGMSYGVGAAAVYLGQLVVGIAAVRSEALPGRLRWAPIGVVVLQFPVFIVAGAIGDGIGDESVADGLGMVLTGALWAGSSAAVWSATRRRSPDAVEQPSHHRDRS